MQSLGQDNEPLVESSEVGIAMGLVDDDDHATDDAVIVEQPMVTVENGLNVDADVSHEGIVIVVPGNPSYLFHKFGWLKSWLKKMSTSQSLKADVAWIHMTMPIEGRKPDQTRRSGINIWI